SQSPPYWLFPVRLFEAATFVPVRLASELTNSRPLSFSATPHPYNNKWPYAPKASPINSRWVPLVAIVSFDNQKFPNWILPSFPWEIRWIVSTLRCPFRCSAICSNPFFAESKTTTLAVLGRPLARRL